MAKTDLTQLLRSLKLSGMAQTYANVALQAAREGLTHEQFLYIIATTEREQRDQRRIERLQKESALPIGKTLSKLDLARFPALVRQQIEHLSTGKFLHQAVNVVAVGTPGVGKTHLLAALGHELVMQGQRVFFSSTTVLVQQLLQAKRDLCLPKLLTSLDRFACIILDDLGYVQQERQEMEVLFTLLSERYERRSLMISTNLMFSQWEQIFKDPMTTVAALDRVIHHSVVLNLMEMVSFRAEEAEKRQAEAAAEAKERQGKSA